jgi:Leucine-rich repeat (LRR) protein
MSRLAGESVKHLNLWKQKLGEVPDYIWSLSDLETLVLADNGLSVVSAEIGNLTSLRMLDLGHNELTAIPETLGSTCVGFQRYPCGQRSCRNWKPGGVRRLQVRE